MLRNRSLSSIHYPLTQLIAVGTLLTSASVMGQQVLYVDSTVRPEGDGSSWTSAMAHLQTALAAAANSGVNEIRIAQGVYTPAMGGTDREATFELVSGLTVRGGYAGLQGDNPDEWNTELYESILSGDLLGNDGPDFENYEDNSYTVVRVHGAGAGTTIYGVTIRGGNADDQTDEAPVNNVLGGGIYSTGSFLVIDSCRIEANYAEHGGGAYAIESNLQVLNSRFVGNHSHFNGGAIRTWELVAPLIIHHSEFIGNRGSGGAAISNRHGPGIEIEYSHFIDNHGSGTGAVQSGNTGTFAQTCSFIRHSTFLNNSAGAVTGAVSLGNCPSVIEHSVFKGNSAEFACGGLLIAQGWAPNWAPRSIVRNCYFLENAAPSMGAALCAMRTDVVNTVFGRNESINGGAVAPVQEFQHISFRNCTFAYNKGYAMIRDLTPLATESDVAIGNSIFWGNTPADFLDIDPVVNISYSNVQHGWNGDGESNISADPIFVNPGSMDYRLSFGSPSASAGSNALIPPGIDTDIAGLPRIIDGIVNMGAYEGEFEQQDSTIELSIEPGEMALLSPDGGAYAPTETPGLVLFNMSSEPVNVQATQFLENPIPDASGHNTLSHIIGLDSDFKDGSLLTRFSIPIRAEDLGGRDFTHVNLTRFHPVHNTWSLAVFHNLQLNPETNHPVGVRRVDIDQLPPFSITPGNYGVYWDSTEQRGFVWAVVDNPGVFNAGIRLCPSNVALPTDNTIDGLDLLAVLSAWGADNSPFDVTYSGSVGFEDLLEVLSSWGECE